MDNNRVFEQIGIGSTVALVAAIINQAFAGQLSYWWIVGVFFATVLFYTGLQNYQGFPFTKFRVTNRRDGRGLLFRKDKPEILEGKQVGEAWQFRATESDYIAVYGPFLQHPLRKGKYRAVYRIKSDNLEGHNNKVTYLDIVASYKGEKGSKVLAARWLTANDFRGSDRYQDFYLDFEAVSDELELELRITPAAKYVLTLDYIRLARRLV